MRGSFIHLDSLPPSSFGVLIGVTIIGSVELPNDAVVEGLVKAEEQYTDFCLLKGAEGDPHISQLELRPLRDGSEYLDGYDATNTVLRLVSRVNLGAGTSGQDIRYNQSVICSKCPQTWTEMQFDAGTTVLNDLLKL